MNDQVGRSTRPPAVVSARSVKVSLVLDPAQVLEALTPFAAVETRIAVAIDTPDRRLEADFAPRAVRRVLAAVAEYGIGNITVLIQGRLGAGDRVLEPALLAQPKQKPGGAAPEARSENERARP
jgi:hypothetical protein